jgi:hypothetical protein
MTSIPSGNNLIDPKCKRFYRNCEDFGLCVNIGEKGFVLAEHPNERFTIFYYGVYGSGRFGRIFESDFINLDSKNKTIEDVQDYVHSKVLFEATENFFIIGFNTYDKNIKWKAKLLTSKNKIVKTNSEEGKSFLLSLNGNVFVNDKKFKRYDYAEIFPNVEYKLNIDENGAMGLFSKEFSIL